MKGARTFFQWIAWALSLFSAGLSVLFFSKAKSPRGMALWMPKLFAGAISPFLALCGAAAALLGYLTRSPIAALLGGLGCFLSARYVRRVTAPNPDFERVFGEDWPKQVIDRATNAQQAGMLHKAWKWVLPDLACEPVLKTDIPFATVPESGEQLLCDVWQPPAGVPRTGIAFIYLHGSGWHLFDKDMMTRPFFCHLANQGHVVMDVAYRLCPETDLLGMLGDVKRAVTWIKANAGHYGVRTDRVVLAGGSAGGHLALLAGYTAGNGLLTPADLHNQDLSVRAVASFYGPADMRLYYRNGEAIFPPIQTPQTPKKPGAVAVFMEKLMRSMMGRTYDRDKDKMVKMSNEWMMRNLLGGLPEEKPDLYALGSPITHAGPDSPATILFQGTDDAITPVAATRGLYQKLRDSGAPVVYREFEGTDHAFDLILPKFNPAAQSAFYDLDRFLALVQ